MKCLNCNAEMTTYELHTLTDKLSYNVCDSCHGLWLDQGVLDKLAYQVKGDIEYSSNEPAEGPASVKKCPRCEDIYLSRVKFIGSDDIVLEKCGNCGGFWLDGGELEKIDAELEDTMKVSKDGFSRFLADTHLPRFCKVIRRKSRKTDFKVPLLPVRHAKPVGKMSYKCPNGDGNLDAYEAYGVRFTSCPRCHGLWIDKDGLRQLRNEMDAAESGGHTRWMNDEIDAIGKTKAWPTDKQCPVRRNSLLISTFFGESKVIVDWCRTCRGIWIDRDAFEAICEFQRNEMSRLTAIEMKRKAAETVKKIWSDRRESTPEDIEDAISAISTLACISVFEHPQLRDFLFNITTAARPFE